MKMFAAVVVSMITLAETCSMPASPTGVLLDAVNLNGLRDVAVSGNYAYVAWHLMGKFFL